jgi:hypothetical protein
MSTTRDTDQILHAWLEEGPVTLPGPTVRAIEVATRATPQRRPALPWPWRIPLMNQRVGLVATLVAVAAVGLGGWYVFGPARSDSSIGQSLPIRTSSPPDAAIASPSSSPVEPTTVTFTSPIYGYSIEHYPVWVPSAATERWKFGAMIGNFEPYIDRFNAPSAGGASYVGIAAQPVPNGMTAQAWMIDYAERVEAFDRLCGGPATAWTDTTVAGVPGRRLVLECKTGLTTPATETVWVVDGVGYVITGNQTVVESMLETFRAS